MTPKQNADELVHKMYRAVGNIYDKELDIDSFSMQREKAKQCALIAADEVLRLINDRVNEWCGWDEERQFWEDTKTETEKL